MKKFLVPLILLLAACSDGPSMLSPCDPADSSKICGIQSAEDMAYIPNSPWAVFSQMTLDYPEDAKNGVGIGLFNMEDHSIHPLFAKRFAHWPMEHQTDLGDKNCPGFPDPAGFAGHGLDVRQLDDGTILMAAVNHGEREAIELFSLDNSGDKPVATWRGCLLLPRGDHHNDVAINGDGSFYFTYFYRSPHHASVGFYWDLLKSLMGFDTGWVNHWSQSTGVTRIPNSEGNTPNGIVASEDGKTLFVNEWMPRQFYRLELTDDGVVRESIPVGSAVDNTTWTPDGQLLVTGQRTSFGDIAKCTLLETITTCDIPYDVYQIDPDTLVSTTLLTGKGTASVALMSQGKVFIGSFLGDNIEVKSLQSDQ